MSVFRKNIFKIDLVHFEFDKLMIGCTKKLICNMGCREN